MQESVVVQEWYNVVGHYQYLSPVYGSSVMSIKPVALKGVAAKRMAPKRRQFPEFPPRDDMQNTLHLYLPSVLSALALYLGELETTLVMSEVPVGPTLDNRDDIRIPDLMVTRDCNPDLVIEERGYAIDSQGKPPGFALEVASVSTGRADYTDKRADYERYGIEEYWRFDPSGGEYHDTALAGDRLAGGGYQPVEVEWLDENRCRGYSDVLGLYVCWEFGRLRLFDPVTGEYLRTHVEDVDRANQEAERARAEAERAERERNARQIAERRVEELEAELRRLQGGQRQS